MKNQTESVSVGERIKQLRLSCNLTQEELGSKVGVKKAAIQKYEKGTVTNIKRSTIAKLSEALQVSPAYLMGWDDPSTVEEGDFIIRDGKLYEYDELKFGVSYKFDQLNEENKEKARTFIDFLLAEQNKPE